MKLKITVDSKTYEVDVEAVESETSNTPPRGYVVEPAPTGVPALALSRPRLQSSVAADETKVCRSPVSGIVVRVNVQAGQSIQTGDILVVLEAMKMETNITAPANGRVASVNIAAGDAVQGGQALVEFE